MSRKIDVFDSTLADREQLPGVKLNLAETPKMTSGLASVMVIADQCRGAD
ncbi:MAG: hypothetical protein PHO29_12445 [Acetobacterium sp.]|nr:hypothetical protein [Acetobacterium sp.]